MRPLQAARLALVAAVVFLAGCPSNNYGKIEGTKWRSVASTVNGRSVPSGFFHVEFGKDGKVFFHAGNVKATGTYSMDWGGDVVTFNFDREIFGRRTHNESITIDGDKLTMTDLDGTAMNFRKVK
jgi:hypothetical protein